MSELNHRDIAIRRAVAEEQERCARVCDELAETAQDEYREIQEEKPLLWWVRMGQLETLYGIYFNAAKVIRGEERP